MLNNGQFSYPMNISVHSLQSTPLKEVAMTAQDLCYPTIAMSHIWLSTFRFFKIQFLSHTTHISSAQQPHVAGGYHS